MILPEGPDLRAELPPGLATLANEWKRHDSRGLYYLPEADVLLFMNGRRPSWFAAAALRSVGPGETITLGAHAMTFRKVRQRRRKKRSPLGAKDSARLRTLHDAGLFSALDEGFLERIAHLLGGEDRLASAIDLLEIYGEPSDFLVRAPQSLQPVAALGLAEVLTEDPAGDVVLRPASGPQRALECRTHQDWARAYNAGLEAQGDPRRFVEIAGPDWEEPLFVLCDSRGARALSETDLVGFDW